jgi:hypothetical protein
MIRAVLPSILLLLLPFVVYFLWLGFQRRRYAENALAKRSHLFWIALVGAALAAAGFLYFVDPSGAPPDSVYVPPRYEGGRVVPGHFERRTDRQP